MRRVGKKQGMGGGGGGEGRGSDVAEIPLVKRKNQKEKRNCKLIINYHVIHKKKAE